MASVSSPVPLLAAAAATTAATPVSAAAPPPPPLSSSSSAAAAAASSSCVTPAETAGGGKEEEPEAGAAARDAGVEANRDGDMEFAAALEEDMVAMKEWLADRTDVGRSGAARIARKLVMEHGLPTPKKLGWMLEKEKKRRKRQQRRGGGGGGLGRSGVSRGVSGEAVGRSPAQEQQSAGGSRGGGQGSRGHAAAATAAAAEGGGSEGAASTPAGSTAVLMTPERMQSGGANGDDRGLVNSGGAEAGTQMNGNRGNGDRSGGSGDDDEDDDEDDDDDDEQPVEDMLNTVLMLDEFDAEEVRNALVREGYLLQEAVPVAAVPAMSVPGPHHHHHAHASPAHHTADAGSPAAAVTAAVAAHATATTATVTAEAQAEAEEHHAYSLDERVEVRYRSGNRWYSGRIAALHVGSQTFDIRYDDGDFEDHVTAQFIRPFSAAPGNAAGAGALGGGAAEPLPVGTYVEARYRGGPTWYAGRVIKQHADGTVDIRYSDGDFEQSVRPDLIRKIPHPHQQATADGGDGASVDMSPLAPGDHVEARFRGSGRFYPGHVQARDDATQTYTILFEDGDREEGVARQNVRRMRPPPAAAALKKGTRVRARFRGGSSFYEGKIIGVDLAEDRFDIQYDDGDRETGVSRDKIQLL